MSKPLIQIDDTVREMNAAEFAAYQKMQLDAQAKESAEQAKAEAKAALLTRLGITADEAALLLS